MSKMKGRRQSGKFRVSTRAASPIAGRKKVWNGNNYPRTCKWDTKNTRNRGAGTGSRWAKQRRHSCCSVPSPPPQRPNVQNNTSQDQRSPAQSQGTPINIEDITKCQWLNYGAHIGNETRSIEFKRGTGNYMALDFRGDVRKYGCAFLNSGGGSLLIGVHDSGVVCGVKFSHKTEDKTRLQVDWIMRFFHPPVLPNSYTLNFLPVVNCRVAIPNLKVLCLTVRVPEAFSEPTLFMVNDKVYIRRDGSVQGPLGASDILEWSRQKWAGKVKQLEQNDRETRYENWFLLGQIQMLLQSMNRPCRILEPPGHTKTTKSSGQKKSPARRNSSPASHSDVNPSG